MYLTWLDTSDMLWHFLTQFYVPHSCMSAFTYPIAVWVLGRAILKHDMWMSQNYTNLFDMSEYVFDFLEGFCFCAHCLSVFHMYVFVFFEIDNLRPLWNEARAFSGLSGSFPGWRGRCCTTTTRTYTSEEEGGGKMVGFLRGVGDVIEKGNLLYENFRIYS